MVKISSNAISHESIEENFANHLLKTKAKDKYSIVLKCICLELTKSITKLVSKLVS